MTQALTKPARTPLAWMAYSSGKALARSTPEACDQAVALMVGTWGALYQPSANASLALEAILGDAEPAEIAQAIIDHARDTTKNERGDVRGKFPPAPAEILDAISKRREAARERVAHQERIDQSCIRAALAEDDPRVVKQVRSADQQRDHEARVARGRQLMRERGIERDSAGANRAGEIVANLTAKFSGESA